MAQGVVAGLFSALCAITVQIGVPVDNVPSRPTALRLFPRAATRWRDHEPRTQLRLRGGGFEETDRILQARMAAARSVVGAAWYNDSAAAEAPVFPWDGWELERRDEEDGGKCMDRRMRGGLR